ncbi:hypothetical protein C8J57DRAFT_1501901 [Mycena rebaudengoi]|nr:hypothetical protein C8J57DRAFT_1501901 [Mycena rebaudengoi]
MAASTTDMAAADNDPSNPVVSIDRVMTGILTSLKRLLTPHTIWKMGTLTNHTGQPISLALPPLTILHVCFWVTQSEVDTAGLFELAAKEKDASMPNAQTYASWHIYSWHFTPVLRPTFQ